MSLLDQSGVTGKGLDPYNVHALFVSMDNMWTERFGNYDCLVIGVSMTPLYSISQEHPNGQFWSLFTQMNFYEYCLELWPQGPRPIFEGKP